MPMTSSSATLAPDRASGVPDGHDTQAPLFHITPSTPEEREMTLDFEEEDIFDFEKADRIRAAIKKRAEELLASGGCPEFDALKEFSTDLANVKFDREEIHERG